MFLTLKEVSKLIGLSVSTINRVVKKRDLTSKVKISLKRMIFIKNEIEEWINAR
ncbi:MAG: helix-turn-helix domain-containing protein [Prochlorococcus marinus CUG1431]|uniref:Helix-turn-helix domain-containing protein n=1 Tax=Prochlorococcus marinus CUG1433 TaxID=2774506 RepID=A0A9D9G0H8_PROMR|nr:helix-turn-helix domain-containing protein [Prochlorococcus marinus CUG1433]MBO6980149.1 helix-turn-helix domain-containing protein [Prochlorococcus marinus CUG1431]